MKNDKRERPNCEDPEMIEALMARALTLAERPPVLQALVKPKRGRPMAASKKVSVTIRYSAPVIEKFRATGSGWQNRMNSALEQYLIEHPF